MSGDTPLATVTLSNMVLMERFGTVKSRSQLRRTLDMTKAAKSHYEYLTRNYAEKVLGYMALYRYNSVRWALSGDEFIGHIDYNLINSKLHIIHNLDSWLDAWALDINGSTTITPYELGELADAHAKLKNIETEMARFILNSEKVVVDYIERQKTTREWHSEKGFWYNLLYGRDK